MREESPFERKSKTPAFPPNILLETTPKMSKEGGMLGL
jgi:hypothetical protein